MAGTPKEYIREFIRVALRDAMKRYGYPEPEPKETEIILQNILAEPFMEFFSDRQIVIMEQEPKLKVKGFVRDLPVIHPSEGTIKDVVEEGARLIVKEWSRRLTL